MSDTNVAQDQIKAYVDRILRMKEEEKAIKDDIREIYAEAKGNGFDKTILGKLVTYVDKRKTDASAVLEGESLFDLYLTAYDSAAGSVGTKRATHTHAPEKPDPLAALRANKDLAIVEAANLQPKSENQLSQPAGGDLVVTPSPSHDHQVATHQPETAPAFADVEAHGADANDLHSNAVAIVPATQDGNADAGGENVVDLATVEKTETLSDAGKLAEASASVAPAPRYAAPGVIVWEHTPPEPVKRHPYSQAFGEMGQDLAVIDDDIAGAKSEPIVRVGNEILDGWARYNCARGMIGGSGISTEYPVKQYDGDNALVDCIRWNVTGRIMTDKQLQLAAKRLIEIEPKRKAEILATFEALSA